MPKVGTLPPVVTDAYQNVLQIQFNLRVVPLQEIGIPTFLSNQSDANLVLPPPIMLSPFPKLLYMVLGFPSVPN